MRRATDRPVADGGLPDHVAEGGLPGPAAGGGTPTRPAPVEGLTEAEAARRLHADGRNEIDTGTRRGLGAAIRAQLTDTVVLVLLGAAVLTVVVGDRPDTAVILAVVVLNTALGTIQQVRADDALAALAVLTAPRAGVVRDGVVRDVDTAEVVVGDLVDLTAGDIVPADATLAEAMSLTVDESMLSGESVPVGRATGDPVLAGSVVTRGRARALVTATARGTAMGEIARGLRDGAATVTPLQRQLARLSRRLAVAAAVAAAVVVGIELAHGSSWESALVLGASLAVAAIPESLPAVVTLSLALAARALTRGGVLARTLSAVEALGSVTVLATDKTGTLTEGRMVLDRVWTPAGGPAAEHDALARAVLCCDARGGADLAGRRSDDPTEVAVVDAAIRAGVDVAGVRRDWPRTGEVPFDARTALMRTTHRTAGDGEPLEVVKGSPEAVLDAADRAGDAGRAVGELAADGLRVLAVRAGRPGDTRTVALLGLADPVRAGAVATVEGFARAGVRTVMITGDHPVTAAAVGRSLGLPGAQDVVVCGAAGVPDDLDAHGVLARVLPMQKSAIVRALQAHGEVVAMTGDGVNDAPALRVADVGIAMGGGTEVAKSAADIVLTGSELAAMLPAIVEGRRVYDNIRRFLRYAMGGGLAEVLVMLIGPLLGMAVPLRAGQILFVNLLTHGLPGVAIGNEPAGADAAHRAPRPPGRALVDRHEAAVIGLYGAVVATVSLLGAGWSAWHHRSGQSTLFVTLTLAQLAIALGGRPPAHRLRDNRLLLAAVVLNVALVLAAVELPWLQDLLLTRGLTGSDLLVAGAGALLCGATATALRRFARPDPVAAPPPA